MRNITANTEPTTAPARLLDPEDPSDEEEASVLDDVAELLEDVVDFGWLTRCVEVG
jgi:hypothetical protein